MPPLLLQEIQRYNILLSKIRRQKRELRRAVKGEIVMNDELDVIFNAVLIGKVPQPWQSGYPSVKPLSSWARDLIERVDQLIVWGRSQPKVFWLGGFICIGFNAKRVSKPKSEKWFGLCVVVCIGL